MNPEEQPAQPEATPAVTEQAQPTDPRYRRRCIIAVALGLLTIGMIAAHGTMRSDEREEHPIYYRQSDLAYSDETKGAFVNNHKVSRDKYRTPFTGWTYCDRVEIDKYVRSVYYKKDVRVFIRLRVPKGGTIRENPAAIVPNSLKNLVTPEDETVEAAFMSADGTQVITNHVIISHPKLLTLIKRIDVPKL